MCIWDISNIPNRLIIIMYSITEFISDTFLKFSINHLECIHYESSSIVRTKSENSRWKTVCVCIIEIVSNIVLYNTYICIIYIVLL